MESLVVIAFIHFHNAIKAKTCLIKQLLYHSGPGLIQKTLLAPRLVRSHILRLVMIVSLADFLLRSSQQTIFLGSCALVITH